MKKSIVFTFLTTVLALTCLYENAYATHNQAGQIEYVHAPLPGQSFRYCFTIITYSRNEATSADRDTLLVNFGDGTSGGAPRTNGSGVPIPGTSVKFNRYEICHTYGGPFTYIVTMQDPNRIADIININFGESVEIPFFLQDTLIIRDPSIFGFNDSPLLFQPPIDTANVGYTFVHNPNAYDPDGDSLVFKLIPPLANINTDVPGYQYPDEINNNPPTGTNSISLNPNTGEFIWTTPQVPGVYNIAFLICEFRNGIFIGNMIRDMQVVVVDSNNSPPQIAEVNDTCVIIGEHLIINVRATDTDIPSQSVKFQAFGGPFEVEVPLAEFIVYDDGPGFALGNFNWQTDCSHIFSQKYTVVFRAEDSFSPPLVDLETWQITLAPPPTPNVTSEIVGRDIQINWESHNCADSEKFRGYTVWRKAGCDSMDIDRCKLGLGGLGYTLLTPDPIKNLFFVDDSAIRGVNYSYRIVAEFADAFTNSNPPTPFNIISSMASDNTCIELPQNAPVMTNADVETTDPDNGQINVAWSKPKAAALDTVVNTGPYVYELYRSVGFEGNNPALIGTWTAQTFSEANDTTFLDEGLNTIQNAYSYTVKFYTAGELLAETAIASTVYLGTSPDDNAVNLTWSFNVPWINYEYNIFREQPDGSFIQIGISEEEAFTDEDLINGKEYCYYIQAIGTYGSDGIVDPLLNRSQITCEIPRDMIPPCPPILTVSNVCENDEEPISDELKNSLSWTNPNESCTDTDDVIGYYIYYTSPFTQEKVLLDSINNPNILSYEHFVETSLAGCYQVTAIDSFYNESAAAQVCVETCIEYELPNVFTPNNDQHNDLFVPRHNQFVSSVNMSIFNRWGQLVYETNDPNINWDGTDIKSGELLKEGVYYYVCEVFEQTSDGIELVSLKLDGYIHLIRGQ
ncbi:MAG: gliding motility-associated C-terminal domain-containing protein [Chitinophagales bacterium]